MFGKCHGVVKSSYQRLRADEAFLISRMVDDSTSDEVRRCLAPSIAPHTPGGRATSIDA